MSCNAVSGDLVGLVGQAVTQLHLAVRVATAKDDHKRHTQQLGVLELHTGADLRTVVEKHLNALLTEVFRQPFSGLSCFGVLTGHSDVNLVRCCGNWPLEALFIQLLFCEDSDQTGHTNAVGPHRRTSTLTVDIEDVNFKGVGVLAAQLENVTNLDAALDL